MDIEPYVGLGEAHFGKTREGIRDLLGEEFESFQKSSDSPILTDSYDSLGLHLYFDDSDRLEYIECFDPAAPTVNKISLLGRPISEASADLKSLGSTVRPYDEGLDFPELGISLYAPDDVVESVGIFPRGRLDKR
jgi:hypothetical protein